MRLYRKTISKIEFILVVLGNPITFFEGTVSSIQWSSLTNQCSTILIFVIHSLNIFNAFHFVSAYFHTISSGKTCQRRSIWRESISYSSTSRYNCCWRTITGSIFKRPSSDCPSTCNFSTNLSIYLPLTELCGWHSLMGGKSMSIMRVRHSSSGHTEVRMVFTMIHSWWWTSICLTPRICYRCWASSMNTTSIGLRCTSWNSWNWSISLSFIIHASLSISSGNGGSFLNLFRTWLFELI
jgi:hypothetical protein